MTHYFKSDGIRITLGNKLGQGGEGAVFEILEYADKVAKIYLASTSGQQVSKLQAMIALKTDELERISAWPEDTIHKTKGGEIIGFMMAKIEGYKPVHELYSPKSRRAEFPHADWRFLINTAANISRAFAIVHNHNHIIGDVNHGNLVVAKDGTVKLIDVDSFQIYNGNKYFYCDVGVAEYTPPELASSDFSKTARNQNHDAFGLAVLNFHLLFLGRHPFAGKYLGTGYMPIDRAIKENRFVYGVDSRTKMMEPPPNTLPLATTSQTVAALFENAFNNNSLFTSRPSAKDWVVSLVDLSKQLKQCGVSASHFYIFSLNYCPWCAFEKKIGIDFFQTKHYTTVQTFHIDLVWPKIQNLKRPRFMELDESCIINMPSSTAKIAKGKTRFRLFVFALISLAILFGIMSGLISLNPWIIVVLVTFAAFSLIPTRNKVIRSFNGKLTLIEAKYKSLLSALNTPLREFDIELAELKSLKTEHQNLATERTKGFEYLKQNIMQAQLGKYLEKFEVQSAILKNIGEGRKQMLISFGVESAADVTLKQVSAVPGFGPTFTKILMDWRNACEKGFKFDYNKGVDPQDIAKLDKKINDKKSQIEGRLNNGTQKLQSLINDFNRIKALKAEELEKISQEYTQSKFDLEYLR
jgi:DNA-binding helix-hairpin-helix protein with protein kinase domain